MEFFYKYFSIVFLLLLPFSSKTQNNPYWQEPSNKQVDSLKKVLATTVNDTLKIYLNRTLGLYYQEINRPTALGYYENMLALSREAKQPVWEAEALSRIGYEYSSSQNYSGALKFLLQAKSLAAQDGIEKGMWRPELLSFKNDAHHARLTVHTNIYNHLSILNYFTREYEKSIAYQRHVRELNNEIKDNALMSLSWLNAGETYRWMGRLDSSEFALNNSLAYSNKSGHTKYKGITLWNLGEIYRKRNQLPKAKAFYRLSAQSNIESESPDFEGMDYQSMADIFQGEGVIDSAFYFSRKALDIYRRINDTLGLFTANASLSKAFESNNQTDSAYYYLKKSIELKEGLNKEERIKNFQVAGFAEQLKLEEQKAEQLTTISRIRTYSFIAGIVVLIFVAAVFYRNFRRQRRDNAKIQQAYSDLKQTQTQLIQSEKMASLGELTAGIAHEIQNPLNFVNNFSEVSKELLDELKEAIGKGDEEDAIEIMNDVIQNLEKINHHGKRADAIVKGMLQHSRSSTDKKEPTDINALADEYLRLSYHGVRAKDKSFNATMQTNFDENIGLVNINPQDIGRVLLNLFTNAFYSVGEKKKLHAEGYEPTVAINSKKINNKIIICVKDNGMGIPRKVLDKIYQPFYTTKPSGQGTGLGLSMSYDIITKGHGGSISASTKEGEFAEFNIELPE